MQYVFYAVYLTVSWSTRCYNSRVVCVWMLWEVNETACSQCRGQAPLKAPARKTPFLHSFKRRTDHDLHPLDPRPAVMRCCVGSVQYRSSPGSMCYNRSCRLFVSNPATWARSYRWGTMPALKDLDHYIENYYMFDVCTSRTTALRPSSTTRKMFSCHVCVRSR